MTHAANSTAHPRHSGFRLTELDSTRGLAALLVFFTHAFAFVNPAVINPMTWKVAHGVLRRLLDGGAAVNYFFVLSGFVLALPFVSGSRATLSVPEFIVRRVVRIMPTYWAALAIALALRALFNSLDLSSANLSRVLVDWGKPLDASVIAAHAGLIFRDFDIRLINGPIWSLSVEMQISLLLPLVIMALGAKQTAAGTLMILATSLFFSARFPGPLLWLPLFVAGVALARHQHQLVGYVNALSRAGSAALFVVACALFWNRELQTVWGYPDPRQEWLSGCGGVLFILLVLGHKAPEWLLRSRVSQLLGRISYSFYLMHLPILQISIFGFRARGWSDGFVFAAAMVLAFAGSIALFVAVEAPSLKWGRLVSRWAARSRGSPGFDHAA